MDKSIFFKNYTAAKAAHSEIKRNARQSSKSPDFDGDLRRISQIILSNSYVGVYSTRDKGFLNRVRTRFSEDFTGYTNFDENGRLSDLFMEALEMAWYAAKRGLKADERGEYARTAPHFSERFAARLIDQIQGQYSDPEFKPLTADEIYYGKGGSK